MTEPPSLGQVLDMIERWQQTRNDSWRSEVRHREFIKASDALLALDIPALKSLAEQHAAQLRERVRAFPRTSVDLKAAANFLAPRREQEEG